ncbi:hypothetical protein COF07_30015 [Bacillus wiedmannii]|uniref:Uncharacterized protein n=1 Tax=Bacillus wiedmannii TaxID=1890302 RepID=A0A2A8BHG3_9BACI|nr:hypothetical protein CN611_25475 [Bacillus wiedmannii]PHA51170.1 hypothetical protein COF07_30015 [Bacillus wiedmannii]
MDSLLFFYGFILVFWFKNCFLARVLARRVGAKPHVLRIYFLNKNYLRTNDLGGSARILASPSRKPLLCFLSVGLARKAHEPKKVPQRQKKKEKAIAFR